MGISERGWGQSNSADVAQLDGVPALIVDDNETNRKILAATLQYWRMPVTLVGGGAAAVAAVERSMQEGKPFRIVLLDSQMPGMDGFAVAERIRSSPAHIGTVIMMLTSGEQYGDAIRCRELGISLYLIKPILRSELQRAMLNALAGREVSVAPGPQVKRVETVRPTRRLRILVAEDNAVNQRLALQLLERQGHHADIVWNGREAVAAVAAMNFDLVLMDVQMPEMDGLEATAAIRKMETGTGKHVPIIALTAHAMKGDRERCLAAGMDGYITKPIRPEELRRTLDDIQVSPAADTAPEATHSTGPQAAPVFDIDGALEHAGGDRDLFQELCSLFLDEAPTLIAAIQEALNQQDAPGLQRAAHTLKGSVSVFCAPAAQKAAFALEQMGRDADLTKADEACGQLLKAMAELKPALTEAAKGAGCRYS
jgi:CheY-like chemotaxis protein